MNFVTGIAAVAALSIVSTTFAGEPRAEERQVIALADTAARRAVSVDVSLEAYAGCYAADGEAFVIARDGDHLTLTTSDSPEAPSLTLQARDRDTFVAIEDSARVDFVRDARGSIVGATLARGVSSPLAGERVTQHGVVSIEDPASPTLAFPRGIVTIYDVTPPAAVAAAH